MQRSAVAVAILSFVAAGSGVAQTTLMPYYSAPYRAFWQHEFGGTVSFPSGGNGFDGGTAFEGLYGFGTGRIDIGLRGGVYDPGELGDAEFIAGVQGRGMFLQHSEEFPLDGSLVVGVGTVGFDSFQFPAGVSFGRRIDVENSEVSIVPYGQPTLILVASDVDTDVIFTLGLGADFRVSRVLDLRLGVGLGDVEGVSVSAVWVR